MKTEEANAHLGYSDTPVLPDSGYHVHDGTRPQPKTVRFPERSAIPDDAVVLFDGTSLEGWRSRKTGGAAEWDVQEGCLCVVPGTGDIQTVKEFGDAQLHLEFRSPEKVDGKGQGRGNSGVFLMGRYEIQILDNYDNPTYADGTVGAIYGQYPPLANPIHAPGEWNGFDILWKAPVFGHGQLLSPAVVTVLLNGVVQHHGQPLQGPTRHKELAKYEPHPPLGPLVLQDHGDLVRFRNIWYRPL
ncbi:MAG: DUF1080 domain-containing protein [Verrucomicrobia bacterium]|jgi:hypothetical protein|nr:DUF1080 domain-containing protein [Verrucomicrobiota bacterium]